MTSICNGSGQLETDENTLAMGVVGSKGKTQRVAQSLQSPQVGARGISRAHTIVDPSGLVRPMGSIVTCLSASNNHEARPYRLALHEKAWWACNCSGGEEG